MSNEIALPAQPGRIGQATAVEQSRAVAEVQAAVVVAQQCPRNLQYAQAEMRQSCQQTALAERAFFRYSRGGSQISGPSVHLARELARCWGNVQYGIAELRRDDDHGQSEMQAWAWDVQTNSRSSTVFVVPHKRDTKDGVKALADMRDIYENNANQGARRMRECIFAILPPWFVEEAKELCSKTLQHGGGKSMPQRIAEVIRTFEETLGITTDQLEQKVERPSGKWTEHDLAQLWVIGKSIQRGEARKEDEFPPPRTTADEIKQQAAAAASASAAAPAEAPPDEQPPAEPKAEPAEPITKADLRKLQLKLSKLKVDSADDAKVVSTIIGRPVDNVEQVRADEAPRLISLLEQCLVDARPGMALDALLSGLTEDGGA